MVKQRVVRGLGHRLQEERSFDNSIDLDFAGSFVHRGNCLSCGQMREGKADQLRAC